MITRRSFLSSAAAIPAATAAIALASCGQQGEQTIAQIIAAIQTGCGILLGPNGVNSVISVVLTILTTFNPTLGAAASVPVAIAEQVEKMICDAFMASKASTSPSAAAPPAAGSTITVQVNGVPVTGTILK